MNEAEFQSSRKFAEGKMLKLMEHESKPHAPVAFPAKNYLEYNREGRKFFYFGTNIFRGFFEENLPKAISTFPLNFGNGNAMSVIHAINKTRPVWKKTRDVITTLGYECFAIIHEDRISSQNEDLLRLDLFRKLEKQPNHKKKYDFTGGILHALKHFTINGKPLSTGTDINDIPYPLKVVEYIIDCFYFGKDSIWENNTKFVSFHNLDLNNDLKFVFYREPNSGVYFINTIHKQTKKDTAKYKRKAQQKGWTNIQLTNLPQ